MSWRASFVLPHRLPNGKTVVDQFLASRRDLPAADREMLRGWNALLRRRKPWYYEREPRRGISVIGDRLTDLLAGKA